MTTVKHFSSTQSGAPTLNNTAGSLLAVLDACLVNGFGLKTCDSVTIASGVGTATISTGHSAIAEGIVVFAGATGSYTALNSERRVNSVGVNTIVFDATGLPDGTATGTITVKCAAAGWVKSFSGTNLGAYKSGNASATGMLLRVDDTVGAYANVRGYETMTDINTGTGVFPTVAQVATNCWYKSVAATARPWFIVTNDKMFYIGFAPNTGYAVTTSICAFGDAISRKSGDAYRAVLYALNSAGATIDNTFNPILLAGVAASHSKYMPRSYCALGSPVFASQTWLDGGSNGTSGYAGRAFPNPADNGIVFTPMMLLEGSGYRGELPGVFACPQAINGGIADGTCVKDVPGYARTLIFKTGMATSNPSYGGVFFDLTGPWGN